VDIGIVNKQKRNIFPLVITSDFLEVVQIWSYIRVPKCLQSVALDPQ